MNFGSADIAPIVVWDVTPFEDATTKALAFMQLAEGFNFMRVAGFKLDPKHVRRLLRTTIPGFDVGSVEAVEPLQVQVASAGDPGGGKGEAERETGSRADRSRLSRLMARTDPKLSRLLASRAESKREAFLGGEDDGAREAFAWAQEVA
jgi:hypothetical protein